MDDIMKLENIRNLNAGTEIDTLIAKHVMGRMVERPDDLSSASEVWYWVHPRRGTLRGEPFSIIDFERSIELYSHSWKEFNPSTNISDAWKVVERMREIDKCWCPNIYWDDDDGLGNPAWICVFNYYGQSRDEYRTISSFDATNVCAAICRAALIAILTKESIA